MTSLLIISHDVVGERMAGPGIRYWEMARALAKLSTVTLTTPGTSLSGPGFDAHAYKPGSWQTLVPAISQADVLLFSGDMLMFFPQLAECGKPLIIEATYPYTFEALQLGSSQSREQQVAGYKARLETMRRAARAGDFFFCANERQRSYWLGVLDSLGRINPDTYSVDNSFRRFIDIVPFALPSRPPQRTGPAMKGVIPGIGPDDEIVLWGGGLWQWLDPLTLVRAVAQLAQRRPQVRLVFPATRHPNPTMPDMPMRQQAEALSDQLGLTGRTVFFGDWVPYEQWSNYLLEADVGASLHFDTLETHFAFRTRILDYIWASLPMVVTGGDSTSELVKAYDLGQVVPPGDAEAVAAALHCLLNTPDLRATHLPRFEEVQPQFTWERVCEPIARFCQNPSLAPDRAAGTIPSTVDKDALAERDAEIKRLHELVRSYEQGRFMRLMRHWHSWRRSLGV
ncbi:MAG: glycosyltransferase family 4 protein [Anaerolineae bacterium]